jgi:prefoldin subunit 5
LNIKRLEELRVAESDLEDSIKTLKDELDRIESKIQLKEQLISNFHREASKIIFGDTN